MADQTRAVDPQAAARLVAEKIAFAHAEFDRTGRAPFVEFGFSDAEDIRVALERAARIEAASLAVFTDMSEVREGTYSEFLAGGPGTVVAYKVAADVIDRLRSALAPAPEGSDDPAIDPDPEWTRNPHIHVDLTGPAPAPGEERQ